MKYLHGSRAHELLCVFCPGQLNPIHALCLTTTPLPQVTGHDDQEPHWDQKPANHK